MLADVLEAAARPRDAVTICQELLADDAMLGLPVAADDGHRTVRAELLIADRLRSIVQKHGRTVYATFDKEAAALFERGKKENDPRAIDQVCRAYPEARVVPAALLELGLLYERAGQLAEAIHTYKRLENLALDDDYRATALWRRAHVYEAKQLMVAARDIYRELQSRYSGKAILDLGRSASAGELAGAELARGLYTSIALEGAVPATPLPLFRRWHWQPREPGQVLQTVVASGMVPSPESGRVFLVEKTGLKLLDPKSGEARWGAELGGPAIWAGYLSDKLIVATARQIAALELSGGAIQWRFDASRTGKEAHRVDPFANPAERPERKEAGGPTLSTFQINNGRVFCLRSHTELLAIDGDTGALDWSFSSPPAEINSNLWIGGERAVLEIDKPNQLVVLSTDDGRPLKRAALEEREHLERPPLPVDENSVILVSDRFTVKRFDLAHGQTSWIYQESKVLPTNGPPRLLGDAETLLVLHDGCKLIRLDAATGKKRWETPLGENLSERPGSIALDQKNLYCVSFENTAGVPRLSMRAVALEDGSRVWSHPLPEREKNSIWSIALAERFVFAFPTAATYPEAGELSVFVRRRDDGALVERLVFQTAVADVTFKIDPRGAILATARGVWGLGFKTFQENQP